jgi:maltooligosyltrehalose trehalohydrolase
VPDPQARATFERSQLKWEELGAKPHATLLEWHRQLIALRRQELTLTDGQMDAVNVRCDAAAGWLVMERGPLTVVCNLGDGPQAVPLAAGRHQTLLASENMPPTAEGTLSLPAEAVAILKRAP